MSSESHKNMDNSQSKKERVFKRKDKNCFYGFNNA